MNSPEGRIFTSWKEIATFLGKGVRTVQRWEKSLGLPVRRPNGMASNAVVATESDLRKWMCNGGEKSAIHQPEFDPEFVRGLADKVQQLEGMHRRLELALSRIEKRFAHVETKVRAKSNLVGIQERRRKPRDVNDRWGDDRDSRFRASEG